jgi:hypothetical protein
MLNPRVLCLLLKLRIKSKASTRSPLSVTTIWFPIVWFSPAGSKIFRAGSQLSPPSVVRENQVGPLKPSALSNAIGGAPSPGGDTSRSQIA